MIFPQFLKKFDHMFKEPTIKFEADLRLRAMLMSSLKLEPVEIMLETNNGNLLGFDKISTGIYFIERGEVTVKYNDSECLCHLNDGSYYGEISYLFQIRNRFLFQI